MEENGYTVQVENVDNLGKVKDDHDIPVQLRGCHTAIVDGYIVEGHVPVKEVRQLLADRPAIAGLAVPGMPPGSPGMETGQTAAYDVLAFDDAGNMEVFASYSN